MIAISGATGHLGRMTAQRVAELGCDPGDLVLTTRTPDAVAELVPGAQARVADFGRPETLASAFGGVRRLLLISTDTVDERSVQHAAAIDAAVAAGVEHIIYTSMLSPAPPNPALIAESHWATEEHLRASGVAYTILRCSLYSDFQVFEAAEALTTGRFVHNRGAGGCSYIARSDCAAAAAAVLTGDGHEGQVYELTGPESLDADSLAALYSEFGDRSVESVSVGDDELLRVLAADAGTDGHVQYGATLAISLGRAIREERFAAVTATVEQLTGRAPRAVSALLEESKNVMRSSVGGL
jgi:NAD(P)H dehydrogenase (quinone)